jgi:hypothetical protein
MYSSPVIGLVTFWAAGFSVAVIVPPIMACLVFAEWISVVMLLDRQ